MLKKKKWPWLLGALALILVIGLALPKVVNPGPEFPLVQGVAVTKGPIVYKISTRGDVQSKHVYDVVPKVAGRVQEVHVKEGDLVAEGQALVTLEVSDLEEQRDDLQLELKIALATLEQIETPSSEGQVASKAALEAALANATRELENAQVLYEAGSFSQSQLSQAELAVKNAQQALANQTPVNSAKKAESDRDLQRLRIEGLRTKIARLEDRIASGLILAPAAGHVSKVMVKALDVVSQQGSIVTIVDTQALQVAINVNQFDIQKIALGQKVNVSADGLRDKVFVGEISAIAAVAQKTAAGQSQETVIPVLVDLKNDAGAFKPNFTAKVEIVVASKDEALMIPYEATRMTKDKGRVAYQITGGRLKELQVQTGIESELFLELTGDALKEGDYLLLNPDESHKDGMQVTFVPQANVQKGDEVKP